MVFENMFKKFISILLIVLLVISNMGSACAWVGNYDCPLELGDTFTVEDVYHRFNHDYAWRRDHIIDVLNNSGLFTCIKFDKNDRIDWEAVYRADKVGSFQEKVDNAWADPDYYNFHVDAHKTIMNLYLYRPENNLLKGSVDFRPANPSKVPVGVHIYMRIQLFIF